MHVPILPIAAGPPWRVGGPAVRCDGPCPPIGSVYRREIRALWPERIRVVASAAHKAPKCAWPSPGVRYAWLASREM